MQVMKLIAIRSLVLGVTAALLWSSSASAHHSFAMFDRKTEVVLTGIVQEFHWTNPHSYIQLLNDKDLSMQALEDYICVRHVMIKL